ncbi:hypothetical protein ACOME3_006633 [Neoechinorhynchus agilis]
MNKAIRASERYLLDHPTTIFSIRKHVYVTPAAIIGLFSLSLILYGFLTPYWLQIWYGIDDSPFKHIGLWQACFSGIRHPLDFYLRRFYHGCWWFYSYEFAKFRLNEFLLPSWLVAAQALGTFALLMDVISLFAILWLINGMWKKEKSILVERLLRIVPILYLTTGILALSSSLVFSFNARKVRSQPNRMKEVVNVPHNEVINNIQKRAWIPKSEYSFLSYSFITMILGAFCSMVAGRSATFFAS